MKNIEARTDKGESDWTRMLTALTPKGRVAQLVGFLSELQPNLVTHKELFHSEDLAGIESALKSALAKGYCGGIATCYLDTKMMQASPYWVGRTGVNDYDDIEWVLKGDPEWKHFGERVPADAREKYPWVADGLVGLTRRNTKPAEVVVNFHPKGYALDPKNHFVANLYSFQDHNKISQRNLYATIAPCTYNTRVLGGNMRRTNNIFLTYRLGDFIRPESPTLILTGTDFFDPFEVDFLGKLADISSLRSHENAYQSDVDILSQSKKMRDMNEIINTNTGTLPHVLGRVPNRLYTVNAHGIAYSISRVTNMTRGETRMYNYMEAINDMVRPDAAAAIEKMNSFFVGHYEVWRDIIELIEGQLSKYFEPILEFIASRDGVKLYEVKEKA